MTNASCESLPRMVGDVISVERSMPPLNDDERTTLESWLDFYRMTLARKCDGLDDEHLRVASVPPSELTLLGLVQHAAEVERNWFRRVLIRDQAPPIFVAREHPGGNDGGFEISAQSSFHVSAQIWQDEISKARANCAMRGLDDTSAFMGSEVSLRWIYLHMITEYARHCGHADLIRECIDGAAGV